MTQLCCVMLSNNTPLAINKYGTRPFRARPLNYKHIRNFNLYTFQIRHLEQGHQMGNDDFVHVLGYVQDEDRNVAINKGFNWLIKNVFDENPNHRFEINKNGGTIDYYWEVYEFKMKLLEL